MQLAIRHPRAVRGLIVASAPFRRDGMVDGFWGGLAGATYADLPSPTARQTLRLAATPHMRSACSTSIESLCSPVLPTGPTPSRIPNARLLIVPGNHGDYLGELVAAAGDPGRSVGHFLFWSTSWDQPEITTQS